MSAAGRPAQTTRGPQPARHPPGSTRPPVPDREGKITKRGVSRRARGDIGQSRTAEVDLFERTVLRAGHCGRTGATRVGIVDAAAPLRPAGIRERPTIRPRLARRPTWRRPWPESETAAARHPRASTVPTPRSRVWSSPTGRGAARTSPWTQPGSPRHGSIPARLPAIPTDVEHEYVGCCFGRAPAVAQPRARRSGIAFFELPLSARSQPTDHGRDRRVGARRCPKEER